MRSASGIRGSDFRFRMSGFGFRVGFQGAGIYLETTSMPAMTTSSSTAQTIRLDFPGTFLEFQISGQELKGLARKHCHVRNAFVVDAFGFRHPIFGFRISSSGFRGLFGNKLHVRDVSDVVHC